MRFGELGDGGCGLPRALCALAMTGGLQGVRRGAGWGHPALRRVTRGAVGRADVGSELSAASGRSSEVSEWPRSKFPASAVRQRRNFGHRNRDIRNTSVPRTRRTDCHTSDIGHWFAMTGFLQGVRCKSGRRGEGTPPYGTVCRGGRPCPPGLDNATPCRAGPVCPAGCGKNSGRAVEDAGPYGWVARSA